jgi:branched-chain amino acid transport system permease protein
MARQSPYLITNYGKDLRLFGSSWKRAGLLLLAALFVVLPLQLDDFWLSLLATVGVYAIGAVGLNLLTGYAGQVSLGHAFFFGVGAYCAAWFGGGSAVGTRDEILFLDLPMIVWLPLAGLIGAALGALVGPVALRLSGQYLAIVSIGLLFVGDWILLGWVSATNGSQGLRIAAEPSIGPVNFSDLNIFGSAFSPEQGEFWFVWALVALVALLAKNIVRSRPGRALQAIRDRDVAAEIAAVAGGIYGMIVVRTITPEIFTGFGGLVTSITFIAIIIVGGISTISGAIVGSLVVVTLRQVTSRFVDLLPFLKQTPNDDGLMLVGQFNLIVFGLLIIIFLLAEPLGLIALWRRVTTYFKAWPFSY